MDRLRSALAVCVAGFVVAPLASAQINYGSFNGNTVVFNDVTEDSTTDGLPLYGSPTVVGDSLSFNPTGFGATATGVGGADTTFGSLSVMIDAQAGNYLGQLLWEEQGEYSLVDAIGNGTTDTAASIAAEVHVEIFEVDGVALGTSLKLSIAMLDFIPSDGDYNLVDDGSATLAAFSGSVIIDIEQALIDNGISFVNGATSLAIQLSNDLIATSEAGTSSFIQKKDSDGTVISIIPTPGTISMFAAGGLLAARRRRR